MVYITRVLHEPITIQGRQAMEEVDFKEKTIDPSVIYMNYIQQNPDPTN